MATSSNLLSCPLKPSAPADIAAGLADYIQTHLEHEAAHPDAIKPDLAQISSFRNAIQSDLPRTQASLTLLIRYHAHLVYILSKFPTDIGVNFVYEAIFSEPSTVAAILPGQLPTSQPIGLCNLQYERACVLFNIAAMSMSLGVAQPRLDVEQLKRAIGFFQQAAGCFSHLKQSVVHLIKTPPGSPDPPSPDLSDACLTALTHLSLAQAQECVWQKAVKDRMSNSLISRMAQEIARLYKLSLTSINEAKQTQGVWIGFSFPADWVRVVNLKSAHFLAVAQFRKSCDDSAANEYGVELGRLELAHSVLKAAISACKTGSDPVTEMVILDAKGLLVKLQKTLETCRRDNDLIYLKAIPSEADLPPIKPVSMAAPKVPPTVVNPLMFLTESGQAGVKEQFGRRLFEFVVPYRVHRAKGVYEDRKHEHVKCVIEDVAERLDSERVHALQSMNLPGALEALERPINLPPSLVRNSEDLRQQQAPQVLLTMLAKVEQASSSNNRALNHITAMLDSEEHEDDRLRTQHGTRLWTMPASKKENKRLREQEAQFRQTSEAAMQSDQAVKAKYQRWIREIQLLSQDEETIQRAMPPPRSADLQSYDLSSHRSAFELSDPRKLRELLDELDDLGIERKTLVDSARRSAARDQLKQETVDQLMSSPEDSVEKIEADEAKLEEMIQNELSKYQSFEDRLESNRIQQETLIERIREANQAFLDSRSQDPGTLARQAMIQELEAAHQEFYSIRQSLQAGAKFHLDFSKFVRQLKEEAERFIAIRREEATELEAKLVSGPALETDQRIKVGSPNGSSSHAKLTTGRGTPVKKTQSQVEQSSGSNGCGGPGVEGGQTPRSGQRRMIQPGVYDPEKHGPIKFFDN